MQGKWKGTEERGTEGQGKDEQDWKGRKNTITCKSYDCTSRKLRKNL